MNYTKNYSFGTDISRVFKNKIIDFIRKKRVIDLGCGKGIYLSYFGKNSMGLDISPKNVALGKKRGLNIKQADLNNLPRIYQKFDVVFSSHVIEHLENPISFLKYSNKLLHKNGLLILSIPNEHSLICKIYPYFNGKGNHLYSFSIRNMTELLEFSGYKVNFIYRDYYTALTKKLKINPFLFIIDFLPDSIKNYLSWSFWFVAEKI